MDSESFNTDRALELEMRMRQALGNLQEIALQCACARGALGMQILSIEPAADTDLPRPRSSGTGD